MKLFVSWSGPRSKAVAEAFGFWLPQAIRAVEYSQSADPDGTETDPRRLDGTAVGIVCLTSDNLTAPRILFETAAMAGANAHVCLFLLDVRPDTLEPPLSQYHCTVCDKDDIRRLFATINEKVEASGARALSEVVLNHSFEAWWPGFRQRLDSVPAVSLAGTTRLGGHS